MTSARPALLLLAAAAAACAGDAPVRTGFDDSAGAQTVAVHGDGFVSVDGRRIPMERLVLELRLATREMAPEDLLRYVVRVRLAPVEGAAASRTQRASRTRLLNELEIMGVRQVVYL